MRTQPEQKRMRAQAARRSASSRLSHPRIRFQFAKFRVTWSARGCGYFKSAMYLSTRVRDAASVVTIPTSTPPHRTPAASLHGRLHATIPPAMALLVKRFGRRVDGCGAHDCYLSDPCHSARGHISVASGPDTHEYTYTGRRLRSYRLSRACSSRPATFRSETADETCPRSLLGGDVLLNRVCRDVPVPGGYAAVAHTVRIGTASSRSLRSVVPFSVCSALNRANDPRRRDAPAKHGRIHQDKHVKRIAVVRTRRGPHKPEIERKHRACRQHAFEYEHAVAGFERVCFGDALWRFDDDQHAVVLEGFQPVE